jgi:fructokinase
VVFRVNKVVDWLSKSASLVVVTDGGDDCFAATRTGLSLKLPAKKTRLIDTVGAGDSFQAALLAQLASKGDPKQALQQLDRRSLEDLISYALSAAAITCSRRGADLPSDKDIKALI